MVKQQTARLRNMSLSLYRVAIEVTRSGRDAAIEYWISRAAIDDPPLAHRLERLRPMGLSR